MNCFTFASAAMKVKSFFVFLFALLLLSACKYGSNAKYRNDTPTSGAIEISVDESFKPVMDSQIQVFESQYPNAKITVHYKPEADCFRDLKYDSIRMVIVTRGLTDEETNILKDTLKFSPPFGNLAYDAIAVIENNQVKDSLFTMADIRSILKGTSGYNYKAVLDGNSSTSTVRFVIDSLLKGDSLGKNVEGAKGSEAVLDYISNNTDAIGLIGVSWIGNKDDPEQSTFLKKVNIAGIECRGCTDGPYVIRIRKVRHIHQQDAQQRETANTIYDRDPLFLCHGRCHSTGGACFVDGYTKKLV